MAPKLTDGRVAADCIRGALMMGDPRVGEVGVRLALVIIVFDIARPVLAIMDAEVGAGVCERASPTLRAAVGRANIIQREYFRADSFAEFAELQIAVSMLKS